ncbi:MAG: energy transducer TonB [Porticoccaceae bacterium]|mgnify:CR=1 FL=1
MIPSRATLYGMAVVAAIAAHGAVVALLWSGPPASPSPPAVHVRLIERPAPVASATQTVAPTAPVAAAPEPGPGLRKKPVLDAGLGPKVQPEPKPVPKPEPEPGSEPQGKPPLRPEPAVQSGRLAEPAAMPQGAPGPAPAQSLPEPELALYCPHRPPPRYPATARRLGQEGVVELQVELSATGAVTEVRVVRSSGWPTLDRAAVAAVRDWHCDAPRVDGAAVAASARQRIRFSLR